MRAAGLLLAVGAWVMTTQAETASTGTQKARIEVLRSYAATAGTAVFELDAAALAGLGVGVSSPELVAQVTGEGTDFALLTRNGQLEHLSGSLSASGTVPMHIAQPGQVQNSTVGDFSIQVRGRAVSFIDSRDIQRPIFELHPRQADFQFDPVRQVLRVHGELVTARSFAHEVLTDPAAAGRTVGLLTLELTLRLSDVDVPVEPPREPPGQPRTGADVIVGDLHQVSSWGQGVNESGVLVNAYSMGTYSCNAGDTPLEWIDGTNRHPLINQALYRYRVAGGAGRFEQLGQAWIKHAFCALQTNICFPCTPYCGGCCDHLGVGCSDPYSAPRNGSASLLGPKSQVNAATADFPANHPTPLGPNPTINGRLQVRTPDIDPAQNPDAVYYIEGMYIGPDDAAAGNDNNNASYRRVAFGNNPPFFSMGFAGTTVRMQAAIRAWAVHDPAVSYADIDIPNDGRMTLAWKVTDLGGGRWDYEYALYNANSHRSGRSFAVPCNGATLSAIGFHDVDYHSGDGAVIGINYDGTDWPVTRGSVLEWATQSEAQNVNANALRWATTYNFRFVANTPPTAGLITIGLYRSGTPDSMTVPAQVPSAPCLPGDLNADRAVNQSDLGILLSAYGSGGAGDLDCDGDTDQADLGTLLSNYGRTCP